ncbi:MAG TPA: SDR family NAD(P)-dependent oxidoreductase [Actinocrinis sp.]|jgi:protochlorophyllide reductase
MPSWDDSDGPVDRALLGRVALVTGASSGIGLHTARRLAALGARTLIGARDPGRALAAAEAILRKHPDAVVEAIRLDLAGLESVREAALEVADRTDRLDLLVNNAGVMMPPPADGGFPRTADGFELQIGVNHLGHFALTGWLLPLLLASARATPEVRPARVVTVSSMSYLVAPRADGGGLSGPADFATLPSNSGWFGYCRSKLANLLFALELARRTRAGPTAPRSYAPQSLAVHPGIASTHVVASSAPGRAPVLGAVMRAGLKVVSQSAASAATPSVYAATSSTVVSGTYYGPRHFAWGAQPVEARISLRARDPGLAARLWAASVQATGVGFDELDYDASGR